MAIVIGLTGGIASGKSTVAKMFKKRNVTVIDADVEARLAVEKGEKAYNEIVATFGNEILLPDNTIDREKLGAIIFHDESLRAKLNSIVHPAIRERMMQKRHQAEQKGEQVIIMDIPLLFENKLTYMVDKTLLVYVDKDVQLNRLMKRNNLTREDALARIKSQMPLVDKKQLADAIVNNNNSIENTEKQLINILKMWNITLPSDN